MASDMRNRPPYNKPLEAIEPLITNVGARGEGDVFSVLLHSPFIIRAFEFSLADGAIDCRHEHEPDTSFADRFWNVDQRRYCPEIPNELVLFDIKSSHADHSYLTTLAQRREVAFYICISFRDTSWVELIPNLHQRPQMAATETAKEKRRKSRVGAEGGSRLLVRSYGLNQGNSPYRMPVALLVEAISRVRQLARGESSLYINPWTLVEFPEWSPLTASSNIFLKPDENTDHYSAFQAAMEIYRCVTFQPMKTKMKIDFVGLQPRLADFKLLLPQGVDSSGRVKYRQVFVQHKIDGRVRSAGNTLDKVTVARGEGEKRTYYFDHLDR